MEFKISKEIFEHVPTLRVGVLMLSGVDNKVDVTDFFDREFGQVEKDVRAKFEGIELSEYPLVRKWRDIYKSFGEKKARSSIEALVKRVAAGKGLYRINPLVDIYNIASLKFELPFGGEDINMMSDSLELTIANGDEEFLCLGATEVESPNKGEIIYKSGDVVVCRNFNYRESDITKLTEDTSNAIIVIEDGMGCDEALNSALDWVSDKVVTLLSAKVERRIILSSDEREMISEA